MKKHKKQSTKRYCDETTSILTLLPGIDENDFYLSEMIGHGHPLDPTLSISELDDFNLWHLITHFNDRMELYIEALSRCSEGRVSDPHIHDLLEIALLGMSKEIGSMELDGSIFQYFENKSDFEPSRADIRRWGFKATFSNKLSELE